MKIYYILKKFVLQKNILDIKEHFLKYLIFQVIIYCLKIMINELNKVLILFPKKILEYLRILKNIMNNYN